MATAATEGRGAGRPERTDRRAAGRPLEHRMLSTATLCLLAGGAVMVYSASSAKDLLAGGGDGSAFLVRYVIYGALGLGLMFGLSRWGLQAVRRITPVLLGVSFIGLLLVMIPGIGMEVNGATRWIGAGPLQLQPSELMKLALVLYAVEMLASRRRPRSLREVLPVLVVGAAACGLVAVEPDLGTALVIAGTLAALLVAAGMPMRQLLLLAGAAGGLVLLFALAEPYRQARLTAFLDPWADAGGTGFQSVQGQIALGSGGLFGVGLGQSVQKVFYLPEAHTDFILAVIGEEFGVVGICGVLLLYGMIAHAGLRVARTAKGAYAKLLAAGLTSLILCQGILNVFTVLGLAPLTGVPLPFISYGSNNLVVLLAAVGLLMNIAAGGSAHLRAVPGNRAKGGGDAHEDPDRRRRDGRARRARAGRGRRAAG